MNFKQVFWEYNFKRDCFSTEHNQTTMKLYFATEALDKTTFTSYFVMFGFFVRPPHKVITKFCTMRNTLNNFLLGVVKII